MLMPIRQRFCLPIQWYWPLWWPPQLGAVHCCVVVHQRTVLVMSVRKSSLHQACVTSVPPTDLHWPVVKVGRLAKARLESNRPAPARFSVMYCHAYHAPLVQSMCRLGLMSIDFMDSGGVEADLMGIDKGLYVFLAGECGAAGTFVDAFGQAGQYFAGAAFGRFGDAFLHQQGHGFGPAHG